MSAKGDKLQSRTMNQFKVTKRLIDLLSVINNRFDDTDNIYEYLLYNRFLDTALGIWLDIIGVLVGIPQRPYEDQTNIFTFKSVGAADDPTRGYGLLANPEGGAYAGLNGLPSNNLIDDETFRQIIKAKIFATYAFPNIPNIYLFIKSAFDVESIVRVPENGEITVELVSTLSVYERRLLVQYAPVASGNNITITNWP